MKDKDLTPCENWVEKLFARHPSDLSSTERVAINNHLSTCPACTATYAAYLKMEARIHSLSPVEPFPSLIPQLLQVDQSMKHAIDSSESATEKLNTTDKQIASTDLSKDARDIASEE